MNKNSTRKIGPKLQDKLLKKTRLFWVINFIHFAFSFGQICHNKP